MPERLTSAQFFARLRDLPSIEARQAFERELGTEKAAILAADSSGFTRTTQRHGIVHFLGVMTLAYAEVTPVITTRGGVVLSENADNILALFNDPNDAVAAAIAMQETLARRNAALPEIERFGMCVGVDYGPVLRLTDDAYGDHVNIAFKIGEDLARRGEVLVTERVASELRATGTTYIRTERLGDADVKLYRVGPAGERTAAVAPPAERG